MNETFTLPSDESTNEITENVFNFDNEKDQYKSIQTTSPPLFSSLLEKATSKDEVPKNRSSIVKKLSKTMKPVKSQKLSSNSKISKSFRLSSVTSGRTPKISGSKAVQLYEFLTDEPKQNDQTNSIDSPPSGSSTPAILKKRVINNLLKNTLKRQNNVTFEDVPEETKMNVSRVKMPNFALIHQKRFEKMESISDYQSRKSERAKLLLSGGKLPVNSSNQSPKLKNETIRKELIGSFNKPSNVSVFPSSPRVQLVSPWRVCNKGILKDTNQNLPDANPQEKKVRITLASDKSLDTSATGITMRKTPFKATSTKSPLVLDINQKPPTNLFKSPVKKTQISNAKTSSRKDQIKPLPSKKVGQEGSACNFKPKALKENLLPKEKTGHTRFGFRVPVKISKNEIVKAVTNKTKLATSSCDMEDKRAVIKGVRSNRRFDLLMQMRLKK